MTAKKKSAKEAGFSFKNPEKNNRLVVCFKHEAGIRASGTAIASTKGVDVAGAQKVLERYPEARIERTFADTEDELDRQTASLAAATGSAVPTLSGFYHVEAKDARQAKTLAAAFDKLDEVAEAYVEPPAFPAAFDPPQVTSAADAPAATPDFTGQQGYLNPATDGIDAKFAWTQAGGRGQGIEIIDIEGAWNFNHEDLLLNQGGVVGGTATTDLGWLNHGTAVQGETSGDRNSFGIVGIADEANFSAVSIFGSGNSTAQALKTAADQLNEGDIILIELHRGGPNSTGSGQFGFIPIEWWAADFAAVQYAVAKGIIVIAAAGNGSQNLDDPVYQGRFDRSQRDSGALLIGAGAPPSGNFGPDRSRLGFSNYGLSVDAQGWGREVVSAGYGDLQGGSNQNRHYTRSFSGTSSASPIVVGAAACLLGIQKARGGAPLTYQEMRQILRTTGSAQVDGPNGPASQRIGNRPDLKAAIALIPQPQAVRSGIATGYWIELVAYPPGSARSLWLLVGGSWKKLDNPSASIQDTVQRAFLGTGSNVRAWYDNGDIVGLVVEGT